MSTLTEIPNAIPDPVPMERWGKDHWSTLAYIEVRIVDYKGKLAEPQMRAGDRYPTRLKPNEEMIEEARLRQTAGEAVPLPTSEELHRHDDWDCLADMYAAGLVTSYPLPHKRANGRLFHRLVFQNAILFSLTPEGERIAGLLRAHRGRGGNFHSFEPS